MAGKLNIDSDAIRQLAEILVETDLTEIEFESDSSRVRVARNVQMVATIPAAQPVHHAPAATVSTTASVAF